MKEVKEKLDKIQDEVVEIKQILAVNTRELEIHIEGVKLAREQNEILKKEMETGFQNLYTEIKPIKAHVSFVKGAMWALGIAGAVLLGLNELGILQKLL